MTESIYSKYNIDPNKLSRDYINNPIKWGEKPNKEDLYYLYIECNLSYVKLKEIFGWTKDKLKIWNNKHQIKKSVDFYIQNTKKTKLEKYGIENYNNMTKMKKTKLEKYGNENYNNRVKAQLSRSEIKIQQKVRGTNLKKYNKDHFFQTELFQKQ